MNPSYYKYCGVPQCKSTTIKTPNKIFIYVPNNEQIRKKWLKLARRDARCLSTDSRMYFCEDHFDLPNDMVNYMEYHIMGKVSQVRIKPGCTPSKFECQEDQRKLMCREQPYYILKKQKMMVISECMNELEERCAQSSSLKDISDTNSGSAKEPTMTGLTVTQKELFLVLRSEKFYKLTSSKCNERLISYILDKFNYSKGMEIEIKNVIKVFVSTLLNKWKDAKENEHRFCEKNSAWLEIELNLPKPFPDAEPAAVPSSSQENPKPKEPALCCSCRGAIPAAAALFRCVQCAGRALLCARCLPHEHRHRDHCLMRLPSTRVHGILEGLFQKLQLDVNELLGKEGGLEEPAGWDEPAGRPSVVKLAADEPLVELPGLDVTQPSGSQFDPLQAFIKEEDPLEAEGRPETDSPYSAKSPSSPSPYARGAKLKRQTKVTSPKRKREESERAAASARARKRAAVASEPRAVASELHDDASAQCGLVEIKQEPLLPGEMDFEEQTLEVCVKQEHLEGDDGWGPSMVYQRNPGDET